MANVPCLRAGVCLASGLFALLATAPTVQGDEPRVASAAIGAVFQDPAGAAAANEHPYLPHAPGRRFVGLSAGMLSCEVCHNVRSEGLPIPGVGGQVAGSWVLANEVGTWGLLDKHYQGQRLVSVIKEPVATLPRLEAEALNGTDKIELFVYGNAALKQAVLVARLDNLGKGASGAAVQNLGIMLGLK